MADYCNRSACRRARKQTGKQFAGKREALSCCGRSRVVETNVENNGLRRHKKPLGVRLHGFLLLLLVVFQYLLRAQLAAASLLDLKFDPDRKELLLNGVPVRKKLSPFHELGEDAFTDPAQFIRARKFEAETHRVITKDGYILTMFRVINPLVPRHLRRKLKPVILQHGLFTSAYNFIIGSDRNTDRPRFDPRDITRTWPIHVYSPQSMFSWQRLAESLNDMTLARLGLSLSSDRAAEPQISESLALELANQGYDVWMGNSRGSTYSLNHTKYDAQYDWRFWDFSFHEIGLYDLPASIDYVLQVRKKSSLAYVGHSQGNLAMFVLQSLHPHWAHKVKPFIALSPIAFVPDIYFGLARLILTLIDSTIITTTRLNRVFKGQLFPKSTATATTLDLICLPKWTTPICDLALTALLGDNFKRSNDTIMPTIAHHIPEGTSILNVLHFAQMVIDSQFRAFDYGPKENWRRYGSATNPFYPIRDITSPDIAFISGRSDTLSTVKNVELTRKALRVALLDDYVVPELFWGHGDHMYAIGAGRLVNAHLIGLIDRYRLIDN